MILYLLRIEVPSVRADEFSKFQSGHVALTVAAMGRDALGMRAKAKALDGTTEFVWLFELPSLARLENYLTSREREDLATELSTVFPEAKVWQSFGELCGGVRRGMRYGEDPGAAFVVDVAIPAGAANGWADWYDRDHLPQVLSDAAFVRARRFELHSETNGQSRHLVIYDAVDIPSVENFQKQAGANHAEAHAKQLPEGTIERQVWEWLA